MFHHLVVAADGSESSLRAFDRALDLAAHLGAALDVVSVEEEPPRLFYVTKQEEVSAEQSAAERYYGQMHAEATLRAAQRGVPVTTKVLAGHEVQSLLDYVCNRRVDVLVLGARGHSRIWETFLGSTADKLVAHTPTSVLVVRPEEPGRTFKELVVGLDGSPLGERALAVALDLCRALGGSLRAISVVERSPIASPSAAQGGTPVLEGSSSSGLCAAAPGQGAARVETPGSPGGGAGE